MITLFGVMKDGSLLAFQVIPGQIGTTNYCKVNRYKSSRHIKVPSKIAALVDLKTQPDFLSFEVNGTKKKFHKIQEMYLVPEDYTPMISQDKIETINKFLEHQRQKKMGFTEIQITTNDINSLTLLNVEVYKKWLETKKLSKKG